jgi:TPR repeat protein
VFRASDRQQRDLMEVHRALKLISGPAADLDRVRKEISAGDTAHQNLVRTIDFGYTDDARTCFFIVMDLVTGGTLADLIRHENGRVDGNRARRLCHGILYGLDALHRRNLVHRDLKPTNILIDIADGTDERPLLSDFGITHSAEGGQTMVHGAGTVGYAAPEQLMGRATFASDIYAFGRIVFELLVGRLPDYGDPPLERLRPELPATVGKLVVACMANDPAKRPQSAKDVIAIFDDSWPIVMDMGTTVGLKQSEQIIERLLEANEYAKAIENTKIERSMGRSTARIEWLCARANRELGKTADAYSAFAEAIRLATPVPSELRQEYADLLVSLGRLEDAATQLDLLLASTTKNSAVSLYLQVLLDLGRRDQASEVAVSRSVVPDDHDLIAETVLPALNNGKYDYVIACGAVVKRDTPQWKPTAAAVGLALFALGDHAKAESFLSESRADPLLGDRVRKALWTTWVQLKKFQEAADLGDEIGAKDSEWLAEHGATMFRLASDVGDSKNKEEARKYRVSAEAGEPWAMYNLGVMYDIGRGVEQNDAKAVYWYRAGAKAGHVSAMFRLGVMYANGRGVERSDVEAVRWYRAGAEAGDANAMVNLGWMYDSGRGVEQSDVEAVRWYRAGAEARNAIAMFHLGWNYANGCGVEQSDVEAVRWYRAGAEAGNTSGMTNIGWMYANGRGVEQSDVEAVRWYRAGAEARNANAMFHLGWMYANGRGVEQSDVEAVRWYRASAEAGDATAMFSLGWMYASGRGVEQSDVEAVRWYRAGAEAGHADAMFRLGVMYDHGRGVEQSDVEAVRWYRAGAEAGDADAMVSLGWMYVSGRGVEQSDVEAVRWYRAGAEAGDANAMFNLGAMYHNGRGVEQSDVEAVRWCEAGAEAGNADAMFRLGVMYDHGMGVEQSDVEAVRWYRAGAEAGHADAMFRLGVMYANGRGVEQSNGEAMRLCQAAAALGNADAQQWLKERERAK